MGSCFGGKPRPIPRAETRPKRRRRDWGEDERLLNGPSATEEDEQPIIPVSRPRASKSSVEGSAIRTAETSSIATFTLCIADDKWVPYSGPCYIQAKLKSLVSGSVVYCTIAETETPGAYEISYTPDSRGGHKLAVSVNRVEIEGSPFDVFVKYPPTMLGPTPVRIIPRLGQPHALCITRNAEIIVSEWDQNKISVFTKDGRKVREFGVMGINEGEFVYPWGVAADKEGFLYVADSFNNRLQKFTGDGKFVKAVGSLGNKPGQFNIPNSIGLGADNMLYVCDTNNRRIQIFDTNLTFRSCFGSRGIAPGQFWTPQAVAFDRKGDTFIADSKNSNIQVFGSDGHYKYQFGSKGARPGKLDGPVGICIDCNDLVYVTEWENHRVSVFDTDGNFVAMFGAEGTEAGEFGHPSGIAVDEDGFVYVCDCDLHNGRIQIF